MKNDSNTTGWHQIQLNNYWAVKPYPVDFPILTSIFKPSLLKDYNSMDYFNLIAIIFAQNILYADGSYSKEEEDHIKEFFYKYYPIEKIQKIDRLIRQYASRDQEPLLSAIIPDVNYLFTPTMKRSMIHLLFTIIKADDHLHQLELDALFKIMRNMNFSYKDINSITAMYIDNYTPFPFADKNRKYGTFNKKEKTKTKAKSKKKSYAFNYSRTNTFQYYLILGINKNATNAQIKTAYRKKVKENHPDLYRNASEMEQNLAKERIRKINKAYEELQRIKKFK